MTLDEQILEASAALDRATEDQTSLYGEFAKSPTDVALNAKLDEIDDRVKEAKRRLTRLQIARTYAAHATDAEAQAAELATFFQNCDNAEKYAAEAAGIAKDIAAHLKGLVPRLAAHAKKLDAADENARLALRYASATKDEYYANVQRMRGILGVQDGVHGLGVGIASALIAAGLPDASEWFTLRRPSTGAPDFDGLPNDAQRRADKLSSLIDNLRRKAASPGQSNV